MPQWEKKTFCSQFIFRERTRYLHTHNNNSNVYIQQNDDHRPVWSSHSAARKVIHKLLISDHDHLMKSILRAPNNESQRKVHVSHVIWLAVGVLAHNGRQFLFYFPQWSCARTSWSLRTHIQLRLLLFANWNLFFMLMCASG